MIKLVYCTNGSTTNLLYRPLVQFSSGLCCLVQHINTKKDIILLAQLYLFSGQTLDSAHFRNIKANNKHFRINIFFNILNITYYNNDHYKNKVN